MPLRSRLLAVPKLRAKYLEYVHKIAEESLDWERLAPFVEQQRQLIEEVVASDTRKLSSLEGFERAFSTEPAPEGTGPNSQPRGKSLHDFVAQRRRFLLNYREAETPSPQPNK